jgi:MoaD family protein
MRITVRVFGDIASVIGRRHTVDLKEGSTVGSLARRIGESSGQRRQGYLGEFKVGGKDLMILVNGRSIDLLGGTATPLRDGDEVVIMQPTAGG